MSNGPRKCPPFCAGAVVQLRSGGPKMTVEGDEDGLIYTTWFGADGNIQNGRFKPQVLKVLENAEAQD